MKICVVAKLDHSKYDYLFNEHIIIKDHLLNFFNIATSKSGNDSNKGASSKMSITLFLESYEASLYTDFARLPFTVFCFLGFF